MRFLMRFLARFRVQNAPYRTLHECCFREASRRLQRKLSHIISRHPSFQFLLTWRYFVAELRDYKPVRGRLWQVLYAKSHRNRMKNRMCKRAFIVIYLLQGCVLTSVVWLCFFRLLLCRSTAPVRWSWRWQWNGGNEPGLLPPRQAPSPRPSPSPSPSPPSSPPSSPSPLPGTTITITSIISITMNFIITVTAITISMIIAVSAVSFIRCDAARLLLHLWSSLREPIITSRPSFPVRSRGETRTAPKRSARACSLTSYSCRPRPPSQNPPAPRWQEAHRAAGPAGTHRARLNSPYPSHVKYWGAAGETISDQMLSKEILCENCMSRPALLRK